MSSLSGNRYYSYLSIAIASHCVELGRRGKFISVIDLVNHLERGKEQGKPGGLADRQARFNFVVLGELD